MNIAHFRDNAEVEASLTLCSMIAATIFSLMFGLIEFLQVPPNAEVLFRLKGLAIPLLLLWGIFFVFCIANNVHKKIMQQRLKESATTLAQ